MSEISDANTPPQVPSHGGEQAPAPIEPISSGRGLLDLLAGWEDLAEGLPDAVDPPVLAEEIF